MPQFTKTKTFSTNESPIASADLNSIGNDVATFLNTTKLDADNIQDGAVTNAKLAGTISASKLDSTTPGYVLLGTTTTGVPTFTALSGDLTVTGAGVTAIGSGKVLTTMIADSNVTTAKIADSNVTTAKIADSNVTTAKIADSNVTTAKIADSNVTTAKIADSNVTTAKINDGAVTAGKLGDKSVKARALSYADIAKGVMGDNAANIPTSMTDISNTSATFTTTTAQTALFFYSALLQANGSSTTTVVLNIDGSDVDKPALLFNVGSAANGNANSAACAAVYSVELSAGSHTVKMRCQSSAGNSGGVTGPSWYCLLMGT